jgi:hypothetical protein
VALAGAGVSRVTCVNILEEQVPVESAYPRSSVRLNARPMRSTTSAIMTARTRARTPDKSAPRLLRIVLINAKKRSRYCIFKHKKNTLVFVAMWPRRVQVCARLRATTPRRSQSRRNVRAPVAMWWVWR